jgi:hypothetical protein
MMRPAGNFAIIQGARGPKPEDTTDDESGMEDEWGWMIGLVFEGLITRKFFSGFFAISLLDKYTLI